MFTPVLWFIHQTRFCAHWNLNVSYIYMQMRANQTRELRVRGKCNIDRLESCAQFTSHVLHIYIYIYRYCECTRFSRWKAFTLFVYFQSTKHTDYTAAAPTAHRLEHRSPRLRTTTRAKYTVFISNGADDDENCETVTLVISNRTNIPPHISLVRTAHWRLCVWCVFAQKHRRFSLLESTTQNHPNIYLPIPIPCWLGGWTRESVFY